MTRTWYSSRLWPCCSQWSLKCECWGVNCRDVISGSVWTDTWWGQHWERPGLTHTGPDVGNTIPLSETHNSDRNMQSICPVRPVLLHYHWIVVSMWTFRRKTTEAFHEIEFKRLPWPAAPVVWFGVTPSCPSCPSCPCSPLPGVAMF